MEERLVGLVKSYEVDKNSGTIVVVIPKIARDELKIEKGLRFQVKVDEGGRIIYERIK